MAFGAPFPQPLSATAPLRHFGQTGRGRWRRLAGAGRKFWLWRTCSSTPRSTYGGKPTYFGKMFRGGDRRSWSPEPRRRSPTRSSRRTTLASAVHLHEPGVSVAIGRKQAVPCVRGDGVEAGWGISFCVDVGVYPPCGLDSRRASRRGSRVHRQATPRSPRSPPSASPHSAPDAAARSGVLGAGTSAAATRSSCSCKGHTKAHSYPVRTAERCRCDRRRSGALAMVSCRSRHTSGLPDRRGRVVRCAPPHAADALAS